MTPPLTFGTFPKIHLIWWPNPSLKQMPSGQHTVPFDAACPLDEQCVCTLCKCCLNCSNKCSCNFANTGADESLTRYLLPRISPDSFWENIILARDLEVLKSIYLFRLTFQTNTVRHQNITKLKCQDVKLDQLSRCQNEKVRVKTANKYITGQQYYINSVPGRAAGAPDH